MDAPVPRTVPIIPTIPVAPALRIEATPPVTDDSNIDNKNIKIEEDATHQTNTEQRVKTLLDLKQKFPEEGAVISKAFSTYRFYIVADAFGRELSLNQSAREAIEAAQDELDTKFDIKTSHINLVCLFLALLHLI